MNTTNTAPVNLKRYTLQNATTRDEALKLLKENMSKCPDIIDISSYLAYGIKLKGKRCKYVVGCGKGNLFTVLPTYSLSQIIIGFIAGIIPGIYYAIQYSRAKSEMAVVLPFIYETLNAKR